MAHTKPWSTRTPDGDLDYIVIGSGIGGMCAAALLAKLGKRVLVLEQHYEPGGFTHTFKRKGWRWDVGVHAVGEVTKRSMPGRLLAHLTDDRLRWASLGEVYDEFYWPEGFRIDFPDTPDKFRANLLAAFPEEHEAIEKWFALAREVAGSMRGYYLSRSLPPGIGRRAEAVFARGAKKWFERHTAEVVAELTDNEQLRAVLVSQWGYYGSTPQRSSFAMQALVTRHFQWGAYYPVGGSDQIARCLLHTVAAAGGWTKIRADVEEILIDEGAVCGVRLRDREGGPGEVIRADRIISAAGVWSTVKRLLPAEYADEGWVRAVARLDPAPPHVCLYLGFEGDITKAGAGAANKWFYETWDTEVSGWAVKPGQPVPRAPILYCSFPSLKDPEHDPGPRQRHTGEVVTFVPWSSFERWRGSRWQRRDEDYEAFKQELHDVILAQYLEYLPELEPMIVHAELSTPLSTDHFVRPYAGSIYGLEPTPERFRNPWLRARSPIKGLFFAGSEVSTVGVVGGMMGGVLAALSAEPVAGGRLMTEVERG
ncbi:Dehydrosqualene desaturase [Enhygromyxa salina]|uniref:Dehydrosqualene desaturase n=1 Tax=Enhygromyxa salina TaxID=215803 RepID=A0A2S9XH74_9BACT|nr:NAD(P)/FAD-dependent oxidoreductase [Enhygromyxa salina]PRP92213.1 Dehydrosqualene desaturase [Enhygromyxa salina]